MKNFILKLLSIVGGVCLIELGLLELVPVDMNNYLLEYNKKIELLKNTPSPRVIVVGGSSVAFNTLSPMIKDSLGCNVINFGLHAGIGSRLPINDIKPFIKQGDIVVITIEYGDFFTSGEGEVPTLTSMMVYKNWQGWEYLNFGQWKNVLYGIPKIAYSNIRRLLSYPIYKTWSSTNISDVTFQYSSKGFNQWGDEISHFKYENITFMEDNYSSYSRVINDGFVKFLYSSCTDIEEHGGKVIMIPPTCLNNYVHHEENNIKLIAEALKEIGYPYFISPSNMTLDKECFFDSKYHCNYQGATINTNRVIQSLRSVAPKAISDIQQ